MNGTVFGGILIGLAAIGGLLLLWDGRRKRGQ